MPDLVIIGDYISTKKITWLVEKQGDGGVYSS
jgi:hypothetical protein